MNRVEEIEFITNLGPRGWGDYTQALIVPYDHHLVPYDEPLVPYKQVPQA